MNEAMKATRTCKGEHQIAATFEYHGKMDGATDISYVPVVACGTNALVLHYVENDSLLQGGKLVLVDAGVEVNGYVSDISRTWPVNGVFSEAQKEVYEMVLEVQKRVITFAVIGNESLDGLQEMTHRLLHSGLERIFGRMVTKREMASIYPHHVGHYMGLDVHDTPTVSRRRIFEHGMVITIEPGVYIPDDEKYGMYRGIGIRIEDDVLVTEDGPVVLSVEAVKEVVDIEALMRIFISK